MAVTKPKTMSSSTLLVYVLYAGQNDSGTLQVLHMISRMCSTPIVGVALQPPVIARLLTQDTSNPDKLLRECPCSPHVGITQQCRHPQNERKQNDRI
jgi:hypothetical protein